MQFFSSRLSALLAVFFALLFPMIAFAQIAPPVSVPPNSFGPLCQATGLCFNSPTTGVWSIATYLSDVLLPAIKIIFVGVGVFFVGWYAVMLVALGYDETSHKQYRNAFMYAAQGMGVIGIAILIVEAVAPSFAGSALIDPTPVATAVDRVVDFLTMLLGALLIFIISYSGFRIIVLQGNESEIETQKKNFFNGLLGVVLLLIARVAVQAILPDGDPVDLVVEAGGMIRFLLEIIAGLSIAAFIVSGFLFLVSLHNDTLRQRARRILLSTVIILLIVVLSHLLISTVLPAGIAPTEIS